MTYPALPQKIAPTASDGQHARSACPDRSQNGVFSGVSARGRCRGAAASRRPASTASTAARRRRSATSLPPSARAIHDRKWTFCARTLRYLFLIQINVWPLCPAQGHRTRQCQRAGCVVRLRWPGCSIPRPFAYSLRNAALGRARTPADRRSAFGLAAPPRPSGRLPGCRPASDPRHPRPCEMACMTCTRSASRRGCVPVTGGSPRMFRTLAAPEVDCFMFRWSP
jgi:hypothetical protein